MVGLRTDPPKKEVVNVVICGRTPISLVVLHTLSTSDLSLNLCGYWDPSKAVWDENAKLKRIEGSFDDILNNKKIDVLILCLTPQVQLKLLKSSYLRPMNPINKLTAPDRPGDYPYIILTPPVSSSCTSNVLLECKNHVGIAMPLRMILPISILSTHISPPQFSRSLSSQHKNCIPARWSLGTLRSFHVRLCASNRILPGHYSWLCEPGVMGGGMVNLYGAGLIDIAYFLSGGLQLTSVSCLTRTFDTDISGRSPIRRISADDYALIIGEFETSASCDISWNGSQPPVAMFCLSSESSIPSAGDNRTDNDFGLRIEVSGSSGRFVIPESLDRIYWTKRKSTSSRKKQVTRHGSQLQSTNGNYIPSADFQPEASVNLPNGKPQIVVPESNKFNTPVALQVTPTRQPVRIEKLDQYTEVAHLHEIPFASNSNSEPQLPPDEPLAMQKAWQAWFTRFSSSFRTDKQKTTDEFLLATPEHWDYIQRTLIAIEKAARLRCWVDVSTSERL